MEKLDLHSPDLTVENVNKLAELFPNVITESLDAVGTPVRAIDFDLLRQELSDHVAEGPQERYQLDWPGKRAALFAANAPITKTLRPVREESVDFEGTKNLFIEGDNLEVLKLLQESYLGKVKLIYIDPPYNTGNDFIYEDDFAESTAEYLKRSGQVDEDGTRLVANTEANGRFHSDWLSMIYPRLKLARRLLRDDGVLVASINDSEHARLVQICDELFGSENHVESIVWKRRYGGGAKEKHIVSIHEYLVVYARDLSRLEELVVDMPEDHVRRYYKLVDDKVASRGPYRLQPLEPAASMADRPNLRFAIAAPDGSEIWPKRQWLWAKDRVETARLDDGLEFKQDGTRWSVAIKQYLLNEDGSRRKTKASSIVDDIFGQTGSSDLKRIFGGKELFPYSKPADLMARLVELFARGDDVVMDLFAGSGSTAHGVMKQSSQDNSHRSFVMVQLAEACDPKSEAFKEGFGTIAELAMERIRRSGAQLLEESPTWRGDVGFRVLRMDDSNLGDVLQTPDEIEQEGLALFTDTVKPDRTSDDLLFQILLHWGLDLAASIATEYLGEREITIVDNGALIAYFAKPVTIEIATAIAERQPLRAVFRDAAFESDADRINAEQIFSEKSPGTDVKVI
jgi:adenine-specific DNA-methyltransferase